MDVLNGRINIVILPLHDALQSVTELGAKLGFDANEFHIERVVLGAEPFRGSRFAHDRNRLMLLDFREQDS